MILIGYFFLLTNLLLLPNFCTVHIV
uniref:Uncharacterized protein n=1 Tax=Anguilla anguilla TaxID=7936 RepID=A0A0E9VEC7_ANGAN